MKTATRLIAALSAFATAATFSAAANATVFAIDYHDKGVWNAYDLENEAYALSFRADQGNDGFWLVVTDGGNPKGDGSSHAILYGDIKNDRITAYTYDGKNSEKSFATGTLLGTYENAFTDGGTHMKYGYDLTNFSLDVSGLNNALGPDFDGVVLGPDAGIWFHQSTGSEFTYGADGSITDYVFDNQTFLDRGNDPTRVLAAVDCASGQNGRPKFLNSCSSTQIAGGIVSPIGTGIVSPIGAGNGGSPTGGSSTGGGSVPTPGGLALILVGLAGIGRKLRNKNV